MIHHSIRLTQFLESCMDAAQKDREVWAVDQEELQSPLAGQEESGNLPSIVHSQLDDLAVFGHEGRVPLDHIYAVQVRGDYEDIIALSEQMKLLSSRSSGHFTIEEGATGQQQALDFYWQIFTVTVDAYGSVIPRIEREPDRVLFGPENAPLRVLWGGPGGTLLEW